MKFLASLLLTNLILFGALAPAQAQQQKKPPASVEKNEAASPPASAPPATAADANKPAPYDNQLLRFAELLGSVSYLRNLCGSPSDEWRNSMQRLLQSDAANESARRERLTAAYNRGYRSFAAVHTTCTAAAVVAEERYRNEGATLASEIAARFGN